MTVFERVKKIAKKNKISLLQLNDRARRHWYQLAPSRSRWFNDQLRRGSRPLQRHRHSLIATPATSHLDW